RTFELWSVIRERPSRFPTRLCGSSRVLPMKLRNLVFRTHLSPPRTSMTVWVVGNDGRPRSISVQVGLGDDNNTQLLDGPLAEGQPLIVGKMSLLSISGLSSISVSATH